MFGKQQSWFCQTCKVGCDLIIAIINEYIDQLDNLVTVSMIKLGHKKRYWAIRLLGSS